MGQIRTFHSGSAGFEAKNVVCARLILNIDAKSYPRLFEVNHRLCN